MFIRRSLMLMLACVSLALGLSLVGCSPPTAKVRTDEGEPQSDPPTANTFKTPDPLDQRLAAALEHVQQRDLRTTNGFWTIFHGILGNGFGVTLLDEKADKRVNAIDYIAGGGELRGLEYRLSPHGAYVVTTAGDPLLHGVGQGHQDQFISEMAQWGMQLSHPFKISGKDFTFEDFCRHSKMQASMTKNQELSWAIIIVSQFYGVDHAWTNMFGEKMTLEDVARYELNQPVDGAACGGTHRLFGLTWAYHLYLQKHGKADGVWLDVARKLDEYKKKAKQFQNPDGAFSTEYLAKADNKPAAALRIGTTGHVLEWLSLAMTDDELRQPWVQEAANALCLLILQNSNSPIDGGGLYHATHGLHMYRTRVFGAAPPPGLAMPLPPAGAVSSPPASAKKEMP